MRTKLAAGLLVATTMFVSVPVWPDGGGLWKDRAEMCGYIDAGMSVAGALREKGLTRVDAKHYAKAMLDNPSPGNPAMKIMDMAINAVYDNYLTPIEELRAKARRHCMKGG